MKRHHPLPNLTALVPDDLWTLICPLFPPQSPRPKGGRPLLDDRSTLAGIVYVLTTGIQWRFLPTQLGFGSPSTCRRRLHTWQAEGIWQKIHTALLNHLASHDKLDWSRCSVDSASIAAPLGGTETGPNPTDRGKLGTKRHLLVDGNGVPLAVLLSAANVHDSRMLEAVVDAVSPVKNGRPGRPRFRPDKLHADKAYDMRRCRYALCLRGVVPRIARRGVESSTSLGTVRWRVERTLAWLVRFRRLQTRYERRADLHLAFTFLACALLCYRRVTGRF
ncbi:IS5 family transposase [Deinococcus hohokamensis]|uniref:IS5 family transposase n=1 Tax=Deinococcus hohokamensis TaxID=309883 RepID=A0ABV9I5S5_9DEIO